MPTIVLFMIPISFVMLILCQKIMSCLTFLVRQLILIRFRAKPSYVCFNTFERLFLQRPTVVG